MGDREADIVKVYQPISNKDYGKYKIMELIWERKEPVEEMTMEEICKALGKTVKIVKEK